MLDTPLGPIGVSISWEGFFERRARESVANGAQLLTNPTNVPPRYRAELMKLMATFVDSELAGAAGVVGNSEPGDQVGASVDPAGRGRSSVPG